MLTDCYIQNIDSKYQIKITSKVLELNISMTENQARELVENIKSADWNKRKSIKAGTCLGTDVFWAINENQSLSMLIGHDDETWEIGVLISIKLIDKLKRVLSFTEK